MHPTRTTHPRLSLRRLATRLLAGATPFALVGAFVSPVHAQTQSAVGVARASEVLIKNYDPLVRSVRMIVPAPMGSKTACSKDNQSTNGDWEAFYCRLDRQILISQKNLDLIESRYGYSAIATLVAHEYAHARQHALTGFLGDVAWSAVFDELQADCIAGVYMRRATPVELSPGLIENSKRFLERLGDYSFQERDWHGTPQMRSKAFDHGYKEGKLDACLASGEYNWRRLLETAPTSVDAVIDRAPQVIDRLIDKGLRFLDGL